MRLLLVAMVVAILPTIALAQVPESKKEMDDSYRLIHTDPSVNSILVIRFPVKANDSNTLPSLAANDSIKTSDTPAPPVYFIQAAQLNQNVEIEWYIWSDCIPAGVDTFYTNERLPTFSFGGCAIDSLGCAGHAITPPWIQVYAAGGS